MSDSMKTAFMLIGVFFTLLTIGLGYTLKLAIDYAEPIVDESYYERGLDYQAHLDRRKKASDMGFQIQGGVFESDSLTRNDRAIEWTLSLPPGHVAQLDNMEMRLVLDQPATSRYRQTLPVESSFIQQKGDRLYFRVPVELVRPGYWEVTVDGSYRMKEEALAFYRIHQVIIE